MILAATVGISFGTTSDITTEAASVIILEGSLLKVDELFNISFRMRSIALQRYNYFILFYLNSLITSSYLLSVVYKLNLFTNSEQCTIA